VSNVKETASGRAEVRRARMDRVRIAMAERGVDVLLLSFGADLPWLTGYEAMPLERLTMLVLHRDADPVLVVPELEAPRVEVLPGLFDLRPWRETESPVAIVAELVDHSPPGAQQGRQGSAGEQRRVIAISDRCWAAPLLELQAALRGARFVRASEVVGPLRAVKDTQEIAALRAAGAAADRVAAALLGGEIRLVGRTEAEVSAELAARLIAEGHRRVDFAIVGSGANAASPHHEPGNRRIGAGEAVVCDFGGTFSLDGEVGYCSDTTRTVWTADEPSPEFRELYDVLETAQRAATAAAVLGASCASIDHVGRAIIAAAGFKDRFIHRIGHGIGIEGHEDPYLVEGNETALVSGHAFSIEPGIYISGRYGARIEDIVVATPEGPLKCNNSPRGLVVVD
jgi:Xaa-Pro aminopeptidase